VVNIVARQTKKIKQMKTTMKLVLVLITFTLYHNTSKASLISINASGIVATEKKEKLIIPANGNIRCIYEDVAGNTWYGSDGDGLIKFDGKKFKSYTIKEGLSGNFVRGIVQDAKGNLWIATNAGIDVFNGLFFKNMIANEYVENKSATCAYIDKNNTLWFGTTHGVYKVKDFKLSYIPLPKATEDLKSTNHAYSVYSITQDKLGNYWFGTEFKGLCKYDGKNFVFIHKNEPLRAAIRSVMVDRKGKVWFGDSAGDLYTYDGKNIENISNKIVQHKGAKIKNVWSIKEESDGKIWVSSIDHGVWTIENNTSVQRYKKESPNKEGVLFIYINRKNNILFGGQGGAVFDEQFNLLFERDGC